MKPGILHLVTFLRLNKVRLNQLLVVHMQHVLIKAHSFHTTEVPWVPSNAGEAYQVYRK